MVSVPGTPETSVLVGFVPAAERGVGGPRVNGSWQALARSGSPAVEQLRLLAVIGTQNLADTSV